MTYLLTQTLNGLFSAALLFLIASGLTLAFGVMKIVNIAHGSFYMLGVYVAYSVFLRTQSLLWGAVVAIAVVGTIGFVMQRYFLRRFAADPAGTNDDDDGVRAAVQGCGVDGVGRRSVHAAVSGLVERFDGGGGRHLSLV